MLVMDTKRASRFIVLAQRSFKLQWKKRTRSWGLSIQRLDILKGLKVL